MNKNATFEKCDELVDTAELDKKSFNVDCSELLEKKLSDDTFGERLRKSRLELGLSISDLAHLCNVTKSIISGYELGRYYPSKKILLILSSTFDMNYLCIEGYTKLVYNYNEFLDNIKLWIDDKKYTQLEAANKLGISPSLFRFWFYGGVIRINTYEKIKKNLKEYNLFK